MGKFNTRSYEKEWMDDLEVSGELLTQTLKELRIINKFLGGNKVTTNGLEKLLATKSKEQLTIADIGCGGGDMMRVMANWARQKKLNINFLGIDANPETVRQARENLSDLDNIVVLTQNVFDPSFLENKVDILTCTLFTHHFTDKDLIDLFKVFKEKVKIGFVINDLHRHPLAYYSIKMLTGAFSRSPMVQNDGPLSVLRAFSKQDLKRILDEASVKNYSIKWFWAFRWQIVSFTKD